ncbi:MAG: restriction endonuclease subunit S [Elusimicrobia bacterium]|nr:restriction endonuclease subunit S [Elusimicrobiota bacterium]
MTEVGQLPRDWHISSLGKLFDVRQGKAMSAASRNGPAPKPFLRTSNVLWGKVDLSTVDKMHFTDEESKKFALRPGDLLVCEGGEVGRAAVWDNQLPGCLYQNHIHRLRRIGENVDPRFFMYWLQEAILHLNIYEGAANRTTIPNLSAARLKEFAIPLPRPEEQRAIAAVLSKIQAAAETQGRIVAALKELKAATMAKVFREGFHRTDATQQTSFGEIPSGWQMLPLREVASVQTGLAKGRLLVGEDVVELPYLRVANVQAGYLDLAEIKTIRLRKSEVPRYALEPGDVLLTEGGDLDKLGRGHVWRGQIPKCVHQNHIFAVRPDTKRLLPEFLAYLAQSPYGRSYFLSVGHKTTNLACINSTKLKDFPVPLANLNDQRRISSLLEKLDQQIECYQREQGALNSLFENALKGLMLGEIRLGSREAEQ